MATRGVRNSIVVATCLVALAGCGGASKIPEVVGEDLAFTRGAMASADLEYDVEQVEVSDPEQDGVVQSATFDSDEGRVLIEVGQLPTITITGTFTLIADPRLETSAEGQSCSGSGGYSDFGTGMNVTVRDGAGAIIATTNSDTAEWVQISGVGGLWCQTAFEVDADIVDFYGVAVGRRGELSYSFDELKAADFHVELTLGG